MAAEAWSEYSDTLQGSETTVLPGRNRDMKLAGNMERTTVRAGTHPDTRLLATHEFPSQTRLIGRIAFAPDTVRFWAWGILNNPLRGGLR